MRNYLLIKTAADRFILPDSLKGSVDGMAIQGIGALANKAGLPTHDPIKVTLYSEDPTVSNYAKENYGGVNRGDTISLRDGELASLFEDYKYNNKPIGRISPYTMLHEYGHTLDNAVARKQFRGFLSKFMPETAYRLFRNDYEQGADDSARILIKSIKNKEERDALLRAYNRSAAYNIYTNKVLRPQHLGYAIGSMAGGAAGMAGGGYLGYKGGGKLYRYLNKDTQNPNYEPTDMHRRANMLGAVVGSIAGGFGGSYLGSGTGEYIGSKFVNQKKLQQAERLMKGIANKHTAGDMLDTYLTLGNIANNNA